MKAHSLLAAAILAASSLAAHAVGRLAEIDIVDRATGGHLPVHWHEGRPYVVGRPGSEYRIVARNRRGEDLLAVVSVDGVNVLTGETASPEQGGHVLHPHASLDIKGWRKSLAETASFYFTSLGDSYAARTGRPADVGVIGVALFRRAPRYQPPAEIAPPLREKRQSQDAASEAPGAKRSQAMPAAPTASLGTGHGRREESHARYTEFERASREPAETIAIYYDSHRNLVAQGVVSNDAWRRDPHPFPSRFVPDPR